MKMRILKKFMKAYKAYDGIYREEFVSIMNISEKASKHDQPKILPCKFNNICKKSPSFRWGMKLKSNT